MKQAVGSARMAVRRIFVQRCVYLFFSLLLLISLAPLVDPTSRASLVRNTIAVLLIVAVVAAVGRTIRSFLFVLVLAIPALLMRWIAPDSSQVRLFELSLLLDAALFATAIVSLLRYAFDREAINADRLWAAAGAYLLIGVLWSVIYAIIDHARPGSFSVRGETVSLHLTDLFYFSFSTLTTTGFGDIVPLTHLGRIAATFEAITGNLFLAILIARLVGIYPTPPASAGMQLGR